PNECARICRTNSIEKTLNVTRYSCSYGDSDRCTDGGKRQSLSDHDAQNVALLRAQRRADADFACPPRHVIREQPVQSNAGENQGEQAKEAGQPGHQVLPKEGAVNLFDLGLVLQAGKVAVELANDALDCRDQRFRIFASAKLEMRAAPLEWKVCCWLDIFFKSSYFVSATIPMTSSPGSLGSDLP